MDGTDLRIYEPTSVDAKWFSNKFNGPGLRYELALSIASGSIVWAQGPFPCGTHSDLQIFRRESKHYLKSEEFVLAEKRYRDERCKWSLDGVRTKFASLARARHETMNRRLKHFKFP